MAENSHFMKRTDDFMNRTEIRLQNQEAAIKSLETQVVQFAQRHNTIPQGGLPRNIEVAKGIGHDQCKAITTRSGLQLKETMGKSETRVPPETHEESEKEDLDVEQTEHEDNAPVESLAALALPAETTRNTVVPGIKFQTNETLEEMRPPPLFPQRLKKKK